MELKNMQLDSTESKDEAQPSMIDGDGPKYPYGLKLDFGPEVLKKLGLSELLKVGQKVMIQAQCIVCSTSAYERNGKDPEMSMSLQITDLGFDQSQPSSKSAAEIFYPENEGSGE